MINLYYAASIVESDRLSRQFAQCAIRTLKSYGNVLTEHIGFDNVLEWEAANEKKGVNVFERDIRWLNDSDLVVADIGKGSTGAGMEVMYGLGVRRIPVLAVYDESRLGSRMVTEFRHPLLTIGQYDSPESLESVLKDYMNRFERSFAARENLIMIDAIDGAGKGVIQEAVKEHGIARGMRVFDASTYIGESDRVPSWDEVRSLLGGSCDLLLVNEPTYGAMGSIVRGNLARAESPHGMISTAQGYSLDREILYNGLVIPALDDGCLVSSDRGLVTSLVYQPVQADMYEGMSREFSQGLILGLPGNSLAMQHCPGLLILPKVSVDVAMGRLAGREKDDCSRFENREFQSEVADVYVEGNIRGLYERRGTRVVEFDMADCPEPQDTKRKVKGILENYLQ